MSLFFRIAVNIKRPCGLAVIKASAMSNTKDTYLQTAVAQYYNKKRIRPPPAPPPRGLLGKRRSLNINLLEFERVFIALQPEVKCSYRSWFALSQIIIIIS